MSDIVERFDRIHRDAPDRPLVHLPATATTLTASDLASAAAVHQRALERLGLSPDTLVMLAFGNRPAVFPFWLACLRARIPVMPVDVGGTPAETIGLAARFGATVAVVPSDSPLAAIRSVEPFGDGLVSVGFPEAEAKPAIVRGATALKITSGSTGLPKATFTTEAELVLDTEHIVEAMGIRPEHTQIAAVPLSHAYGLGNVLMPVLMQGTAVVLRDGFVPHALPTDARTYGADIFKGVPFMFEHFAATPPPGGWPPRLRLLVSAGARLEAPTVRRFFEVCGVKVHSFYGTSETGGIAFDDSSEIHPETTVGHLLRDVQVTLRPEPGAPAEGGRVHVAGPTVAAGYAGEVESDGAFVEGGYLTGDIGRLDAGGRLMLLGRVSRFVNVAGRKVQPEEVEAVLRNMPGVADARVLGAPDAFRGQQVVACVVAAGPALDMLEIRQYCAARLAAYKVPRTLIWLDRIPLTVRGKTDRVQLEAIVSARLGPAT
ncbi:MAG: fatty acid--CoA ligase family protein [Vicinamibacterales bacterium]